MTHIPAQGIIVHQVFRMATIGVDPIIDLILLVPDVSFVVALDPIVGGSCFGNLIGLPTHGGISGNGPGILNNA